MCKYTSSYLFLVLVPLLILIFPNQSFTQSTLDCSQCHGAEHNLWLLSHHANTQNDVADELAEEWTGFLPDSVILG